jgi:Zn-dependent metalloprotease
MTRKIVLLSLSFAFSTAQSQVFQQQDAERQIKGATVCKLDPETSLPEFVRFRADARIPVVNFATWTKENLKLKAGSELKLQKTSKDAVGIEHQKFQQFYKGIPVVAGTYTAHIRNGLIESMSGDIFTLTQEPNPVITSEQALATSMDWMEVEELMFDFPGADAELKRITHNPNATWKPKAELVYSPILNDYPGTTARLAWKVDIYAIKPLRRTEVYVDAINGEVIFYNDRLHTTDVIGTAHTRYSGVQEITTDSMGNGLFRLVESGRGGGIETLNALTTTNQGSAVDFLDSNNIWQNVNSFEDEVATDAHWGAEMTYDYYKIIQNRLSWDDNDAQITTYVHWDENLSNAFWDGTTMNFGDGGGGASPFGSLDVLGHEFTHGVTQEAAGLFYQDESGALNESFSDVMGAAIEFWVRPTQFNWIIGEDCVPGGIRNMQNPNSFGNPSDYEGLFWFTGAGDNGGVHTNSGVQNFWFYLLSTGGVGTNDNGEAYNVSGITIPVAAQIAYRTLNVYLSPSSNYEDARFYSIQAAIDLYGECSPEMISTMNAWHAVSVGFPYTTNLSSAFSADEIEYCVAPAAVHFINQSQGAITWLWRFGDGQTSNDLNPIHNYAFYGTYDVTLIVNGCGTAADTIVMNDFILIDDSVACRLTMAVNNGGDTIQNCSGTLLDTGGNLNYENNSTSIITIMPPSATSITLNFVSFDFQTSGDYLAIYDGPTASSPVIGNFNGNNLPMGGTITTSGGSVTLKEVSNSFGNDPGFEVDWSCEGFIGVDDPSTTLFSVYPNPAADQVIIRMENNTQGEVQMEMMDLLGNMILVQPVASSGSTRISVSEIPAGIYFLRLNVNGATQVQKLVIQ